MIFAALPTITISVSASDWGSVLPEIITSAGLLTMLLLDVFLPERRKIEITTGVTILTLVLAFISSMYLWTHGTTWTQGSRIPFYGMVTSDKFAMFFNYVILIAAVLTVMMSPDYIRTSTFDAGEYYALLLAATTGMMLMAAANNFMVIFLALELLSLALYILSGFERQRERSQEAGFKYFLLSSFASAFLIYGMAMIYGATGTTHLHVINLCLRATYCAPNAVNSPLLFVGMGLMVVGFAFKVSIVPFHMWTPDVYEGAPTPVTAFMSVTTKAALFAAFVRVFDLSFSAVQSHWYGVLAALAVATMIVGNVIALAQTNMKRLLAYSGIAHAGYVLVAVAVVNVNGRFTQGMAAVAFYFLVYAFMNIGAFILVSVLESRGEVGDEIASYRGLAYRNPALFLATAVFMFSLAGFPPTGGFFAKYVVFSAAVQAGHTELAIIGVLSSLVSVFYYLRVPFVMLQRPEPGHDQEVVIPGLSDIAMAAMVAGTIGFGIIPQGFYNLATEAVNGVLAAFGS